MQIVNWPQDISSAALKAHREVEGVYEALSGRRIGGPNNVCLSSLGYEGTLDRLVTIFQQALYHANPKNNVGKLNDEMWTLAYALTPAMLSGIGWSLPSDCESIAASTIDKVYNHLLPDMRERWQRNRIAKVLYLIGDSRSFAVLTEPIDEERIRIIGELLDLSVFVAGTGVLRESRSLLETGGLTAVPVAPMGCLAPDFRANLCARYSGHLIEFINTMLASKIKIDDIEAMGKLLLLIEHPAALQTFFSLVELCGGIFFKSDGFYTDEDRQELAICSEGLSERPKDVIYLISPSLEGPDLYRKLFMQRVVNNSTEKDLSAALRCRHAIIRWLALKSITASCPLNPATFEGMRKVFLFASVKPVLDEALKDPSKPVRNEAQKAISALYPKP